MREMKTRRAPQSAIEYAVEVFEQLMARQESAVAEGAAKAAQEARRSYERDRKYAQRHGGMSRDLSGTCPGNVPDKFGTEAGQVPDPRFSPRSPLSSPLPHTRKAAATARDEGIVWPDLSEYPTVETVRQWALAMSVPPECADKWHGIQALAFWENPGTARPMPTSEALLRPVFNSYASGWKHTAAREARIEKSRTFRPANGKPTSTAFTSAKAEARHAPENLTRAENRPPRAPSPAPDEYPGT